MYHTFLLPFCVPSPSPFSLLKYVMKSRSFVRAVMLVLQNSNRRILKAQKSYVKHVLEDGCIAGAQVRCPLKQNKWNVKLLCVASLLLVLNQTLP